MPRVSLTARGLTTLKVLPGETQTDYWDAIQKGLGLRVGAGGTRTFLIRYRHAGRQRRLKLGLYPDLTLAAAREEAREKLAKAQKGEDPALVREEAREAEPDESATTFAALVKEVLAAKAVKNARKRPDAERTKTERLWALNRDVLPAWGDRQVASITRRDVVQLLDSIVARGASVQANRTLAIVRSIFNVGLERGFPTLESNPAHKLEAPAPEAPRNRYLEVEELPAFWRATEPETPVMRAIFRLTLLTAQRVDNVRSLRWADIDDRGVWHIPAAQFKGRRDHLVPLSAEALAVLDDVRHLTGEGDYAFPGRSDASKPHVISTHAALDRIRKRSGLPAWHLHDARRSFRTIATREAKPADPRDPAGLGVAPHVADAVLGHKEPSLGFATYTGVPETYLLAEKRDALARWGRFVAAAVKKEVD